MLFTLARGTLFETNIRSLKREFFASGGIGQKVLKLKLKLKLATRPLAANQTFLSIEKRKERGRKNESFVFHHLGSML